MNPISFAAQTGDETIMAQGMVQVTGEGLADISDAQIFVLFFGCAIIYFALQRRKKRMKTKTRKRKR